MWPGEIAGQQFGRADLEEFYKPRIAIVEQGVGVPLYALSAAWTNNSQLFLGHDTSRRIDRYGGALRASILACALSGVTVETLTSVAHFGGLLEMFVLGELRRQLAALQSTEYCNGRPDN